MLPTQSVKRLLLESPNPLPNVAAIIGAFHFSVPGYDMPLWKIYVAALNHMSRDAHPLLRRTTTPHAPEKFLFLGNMIATYSSLIETLNAHSFTVQDVVDTMELCQVGCFGEVKRLIRDAIAHGNDEEASSTATVTKEIHLPMDAFDDRVSAARLLMLAPFTTPLPGVQNVIQLFSAQHPMRDPTWMEYADWLSRRPQANKNGNFCAYTKYPGFIKSLESYAYNLFFIILTLEEMGQEDMRAIAACIRVGLESEGIVMPPELLSPAEIPPPPVDLPPSIPLAGVAATAVSACVICLERPSNIVLVPCGHLCLCDTCDRARPVTQCPKCRADIVSHVKTFL